jgi:signal transduction histidine kinase
VVRSHHPNRCIYGDLVSLFRRSESQGDDAARAKERERHALDVHDNIVQGLAEAQLAFDLGRNDQARDAVERTLAQARRIVTELMGEPGPGDLRRSSPADQ